MEKWGDCLTEKGREKLSGYLSTDNQEYHQREKKLAQIEEMVVRDLGTLRHEEEHFEGKQQGRCISKQHIGQNCNP